MKLHYLYDPELILFLMMAMLCCFLRQMDPISHTIIYEDAFCCHELKIEQSLDHISNSSIFSAANNGELREIVIRRKLKKRLFFSNREERLISGDFNWANFLEYKSREQRNFHPDLFQTFNTSHQAFSWKSKDLLSNTKWEAFQKIQTGRTVFTTYQ